MSCRCPCASTVLEQVRDGIRLNRGSGCAEPPPSRPCASKNACHGTRLNRGFGFALGLHYCCCFAAKIGCTDAPAPQPSSNRFGTVFGLIGAVAAPRQSSNFVGLRRTPSVSAMCKQKYLPWHSTHCHGTRLNRGFGFALGLHYCCCFAAKIVWSRPNQSKLCFGSRLEQGLTFAIFAASQRR